MMQTTCPKTPVLERLLLGRIAAAEADALEAHVASCSHCAHELDMLRADDPLVQAVRQVRDSAPSPDDEVIAAMIPWLKRLRPHDGTQTLGGAATDNTETLSGTYDFLQPAVDKQEMGRLGHYSILRPLGAGGMGMVFQARDPRLRRDVALKVIRPELVARADVRERFLQEAQAIAAIEHDNIVAIFQVDEDRGIPYLAMPLLRGQTLEDRLKQGRLSVEQMLAIGREIAAGLAAAHEHGLIHRDIKPGNIFLQSRGPSLQSAPDSSLVKILDFGLALAVQTAEKGELRASVIGETPSESPRTPVADAPGSPKVLGTPAYMAPEQVQGVDVDARSDLFSLGCVLYRMATGKAPFTGRDVINVLIEVATVEPPSPRTLNPQLPVAFSDLIVKLLAKRPEDRPPSARSVVDSLEAIERRRQPRPGLIRWLAATAALVLIAASVTAWLLPSHEKPVPPPTLIPVSFDYDAADARLVLNGAQQSRTIDVRTASNLKLAPGVYTLRPAVAIEGRRLTPDSIVVKPGEVASFTLRLVGEVDRLRFHDDPVRGVALASVNGSLLALSAADDSCLVGWQPLKSAAPVILGRHEGPITALALSIDGKTAATVSPQGRSGGAGSILHLWDVTRSLQEVPLLSLPGHGSRLTSLAFAPRNDQLLAGGGDGSVLLWDLATRSATKAFTGHERLTVHAVAFSADGKRAASAGADRQVIVWDVASGAVLQKLLGHTNTVTGVAFCGTDQVISAGWDGTLRVWTLPMGDCRVLKLDAEIGCLAATPDGRRAIVGGLRKRAGVVQVWDLASGKEVCTFSGHQGSVLSVAVSADGRYVLSGGADSTVRLWELPRGEN